MANPFATGTTPVSGAAVAVPTGFPPIAVYACYPGAGGFFAATALGTGTLNLTSGELLAHAIVLSPTDGFTLDTGFVGEVSWMAFGAGDAFACGTYTGDGSGPRPIPRLGITDPQFSYVGRVNPPAPTSTGWDTSLPFVSTLPSVRVYDAVDPDLEYPAFAAWTPLAAVPAPGQVTLEPYIVWRIRGDDDVLWDTTVSPLNPTGAILYPFAVAPDQAASLDGATIYTIGTHWAVARSGDSPFETVIQRPEGVSAATPIPAGATVRLRRFTNAKITVSIGTGGPYVVKSLDGATTYTEGVDYTITTPGSVDRFNVIKPFGGAVFTWIGTPIPTARIYGILPALVTVVAAPQVSVYRSASLVEVPRASRFFAPFDTSGTTFGANKHFFTSRADFVGIDAVGGADFRVSGLQNISGQLYLWIAWKAAAGFCAHVPYRGNRGHRTWGTRMNLVMPTQTYDLFAVDGDTPTTHEVFPDTPIAGFQTLHASAQWDTAFEFFGAAVQTEAVVTNLAGTVTYVEGTHYTRAIVGADTVFTPVTGLDPIVRIHGVLGGTPQSSQLYVRGNAIVSQPLAGLGFTPAAVVIVPAPRPTCTDTFHPEMTWKNPAMAALEAARSLTMASGQVLDADDEGDSAILTIGPGGFTVGLSPGVNEVDDPYDAFAFGDAAEPDPPGLVCEFFETTAEGPQGAGTVLTWGALRVAAEDPGTELFILTAAGRRHLTAGPVGGPYGGSPIRFTLTTGADFSRFRIRHIFSEGNTIPVPVNTVWLRGYSADGTLVAEASGSAATVEIVGTFRSVVVDDLEVLLRRRAAAPPRRPR